MKVKPGRAGIVRVAWPVVLGEHATNDIFVDRDPEGMRDLLGDAHTAEARIAPGSDCAGKVPR